MVLMMPTLHRVSLLPQSKTSAASVAGVQTPCAPPSCADTRYSWTSCVSRTFPSQTTTHATQASRRRCWRTARTRSATYRCVSRPRGANQQGAPVCACVRAVRACGVAYARACLPVRMRARPSVRSSDVHLSVRPRALVGAIAGSVWSGLTGDVHIHTRTASAVPSRARLATHQLCDYAHPAAVTSNGC